MINNYLSSIIRMLISLLAGESNMWTNNNKFLFNQLFAHLSHYIVFVVVFIIENIVCCIFSGNDDS